MGVMRECANFASPWVRGRLMIRGVDELIAIREAEVRISGACRTLGHEMVGLAEAIGRVLAEPLLADRPLPPFPRSMMDGVAFHSERIDAAVPLRIAGLHAAGDPPPRALGAGEAWEIMTGAAVPDDCDTVVPYEELTEEFALTEPFKAGQCIHPRGLDAGEGDVLTADGTLIGPAEIAIAASIGKTEVKVFRRPRVALVTTGDEAIPVGEEPQPWQIRRSNGRMLETALSRMGCAPVRHIHVSDDPEEAGGAIREALAEADVVILCGGISMGRKDHVRGLIEGGLGAPAFHGVMLRPGKPLAFWSGPPCVFALPGNPVSVLATFTRFVVPALLRMQGVGAFAPLRVAVDAAPLPKFSWLLTVAKDGDGRLVPNAPKNSGDFVSIAGSVGIVEIPPQTDFTPGQSFAFHPFP